MRKSILELKQNFKKRKNKMARFGSIEEIVDVSREKCPRLKESELIKTWKHLA